MSDPIIFHVDVNSAFLSWSAAYRTEVLGEKTDLRELPAAIVGDRDNRHGIILAKSIEAKRYGVKTGQPLHEALQLCPQLVTAPPDYRLYSQMSKKFIGLLRQYAPKVEQFSIDEAWMDMTGTERLYGAPLLIAQTIQKELHARFGFTVNIGISSNKLLAKLASDFEKPNRIHTLFPWELEQKLWPLPIRDLFLVGRATEQKLHHLGIRTIGALANADPALIKRHLHQPGIQLWNYANGRYRPPVNAVRADNKSYGNSLTLPADVEEYEQADPVLLLLCETVGTRLRRDGKAAACIAVRTRTKQFQNTIHQAQLHGGTDATYEIYQQTRILLRQMWDQSQPLRQLGVQVTKLAEQPYRQYSFFSGAGSLRERTVDGTLDQLRSRFGKQAVVRAQLLTPPMLALAGTIGPQHERGVTKPA